MDRVCTIKKGLMDFVLFCSQQLEHVARCCGGELTIHVMKNSARRYWPLNNHPAPRVSSMLLIIVENSHRNSSTVAMWPFRSHMRVAVSADLGRCQKLGKYQQSFCDEVFSRNSETEH